MTHKKSLPAFSSEIVMSLEDLDDILNFVDTISHHSNSRKVLALCVNNIAKFFKHSLALP